MSYVVVNKYHSRIGEDGTVERFEVGDAIDPTENELAAFPDRFRKLDDPVPARVSRRQSAAEDKVDDA